MWFALTLKKVLASLIGTDRSLHNFTVNCSDTNLFSDICSCLKGFRSVCAASGTQHDFLNPMLLLYPCALECGVF